MALQITRGVILKVASIEVKKLLTSAEPVVSIVALIILKAISVIIIVGTVVKLIYRICVNKSVPAIAGARFVVSLRGDILSPKYAPEITAPATIPPGIPRAVVPIPIKAIPTVAEVVQELPVAIDIIAAITTEAGRNISGLSTCKP